MEKHVIIIGGGAAGFFAAIHHKERHPNDQVTIIEKSKHVLSKVKISGGGRCNVTHACFEPARLCEHYPRGSKELRGPFHSFQPQDTINWFEDHGVPLKTEADNRVFPVSDSSQTIIDCLLNTATDLGVKIWTQCGVNSLSKEDDAFTVFLDNGDTHTCHKIVLATGSNPKGYQLAESLGHTIIAQVPSLFTFKINDPKLHTLSGLSIDDAQVWLEGQKKQDQNGPLLITHWGLSGPSIIKLSAWQAQHLFNQNYNVTLIVNSLPHYTPTHIDDTLLANRHNSPKKAIGTTSPFPEIPQRLWQYLIETSGITPNASWQSLAETTLQKLAVYIQNIPFTVTGKGQFKEEFVTCGGVALNEINFKTMESKQCPNLHIVGELLNIDGITGGFNFQNAWTTGFLSAG